ncbi:MAG: bifunctional metallophosphatase/5'-nucleotidase [Chitinophagaceae bacterium]|nr:bifunctional metallophosphatase/5'-nucleotidase [Chitinophagaceae bacterium]
MQFPIRCILLLTIIFSVSCTTSRRTGSPKKDDGRLEVTFIQVNDVYEIAPTSGGNAGGMARVAAIKKEYLKQNTNTFLVMAGDFVSPSIYNSLVYAGKRIRGKQMIEAMNAAGIDLAVFGNHEFDITESELQERINESSFRWIASNSFHKKNGNTIPFEKQSGNNISVFPQTFILPLTDADGTAVKIGFIGITLPFNKADYVDYTDPLSTAEKLYNQLKDSCDAVVAITHQKIDDDLLLANQLPNLTVILGGHEHDMRFEKAGNVFITKAHANAKSAYIIKLIVDKNKKINEVLPTLKMLDETVMPDSATNVVVQKWAAVANQNYATLGFDVKKVILATGDSLDGRETEIRSGPTNFTRIITMAMAAACPDADLAIVNAGSIRLDDILYPPITQYDILRSLPFGGPIREAEIKGSLLIRILEAGNANNGSGGYLHYYPVEYRPLQTDPTRGEWILNGTAIDTSKLYRVAFSDFLVTGKEANLEFLNKENPEMIKLYDADTSPASPKSDIRLAIVKYLEKLNR